MNLFLSYAHDDTDIANELASVLRSGGQKVWQDNVISTGERWQESLRNAINDAEGIVLALTPNWIASPWCQWEFVTAVELKKKVIPVLLSETELPDRISQYQYVNFIEGFSDTDRVQRFLDDLLILATEIEIDVVSDVSKPELERQINQEVRLSNVIDSHVSTNQNLESNTVVGEQGVVTGDINSSTITINQETTSIGSQTIKRGEKQPNWTTPVVIGLLLAFISTVAAVVALLPEVQRDNVLFSIGAIPASATPTPTATITPTATPTATPTLTPTTTPVPLSAAEFNVVVAGFGYENENGEIGQSRIADNMSDIIAHELNQITQIDNTLHWQSNGVGHILGMTPTERERQAAEIALRLNADVVIYGIISSDGIFNRFEPEFYIAAAFAAHEPELVGSDYMGSAIEFVGDSEDQILAANSFQRRLGVIRQFLRGLAFYLAGNFEGAHATFSDALNIEDEGLEILHIFAGNASVRVPNLDQAFEHYTVALEQRPDYARALIGRGIVFFGMAVDKAGENPPPYDPQLVLDSRTSCDDIDIALPEEPQLLGQLALMCYRQADNSPDKPATADIDIKVAFGTGQTGLWLSIHEYGDHWNEVETELSLIVETYESSSDIRQSRLRSSAANAHAWIGLKLIILEGESQQAMCRALYHYRNAVALLREDVNRSYNQRWIDLYTQQVGVIEQWLSDRSLSCERDVEIRTNTPSL